MAQCAGYHRVRARQREGRCVVIEGCGRPIRSGMADRTVRRKCGADVVRYRSTQGSGALPGSQMAAIAGCRIQRVVVAYVARNARCWRRRNMHSRQCKPCRCVVERCRRPTDCRVASGAVRYGERGSGRGVWGRIGLLPGRQMATGVTTIGRSNRQTVVVGDVSQIAGHVGMAVSQREPGCAVIEDARGPRSDWVASGAR